MKYQQRNTRKSYDQSKLNRVNDGDTDPMLPRINTYAPWVVPLPVSRSARFWQGVGRFFTILVKKINQLLGLLLFVLLLLLLLRLLLIGFDTTRSMFSHWILFLTSPLVQPFENLFPNPTYMGYLIEASTLCAMVTSTLAVVLLRMFFRLLVTRPR